MDRKKVLLLQLPIPRLVFHETNAPVNFPLAPGYLKAMAWGRGLEEQYDIEIPGHVTADLAGDAFIIDEIVRKKPAVLGMSLYSWNLERSLHIISAVKERLPRVLTVVGGEEVTGSAPRLFAHPGVDLGVIGPGEETFSELLSALSDKGNLEKVTGTGFFRDGGIFLAPPRRRHIPADAIPSPYLLDFFPLQDYRLMWLETARGCPFRCTYCCEPSRRTAHVEPFSLERLRKEILYGKEKGIPLLFFWDSMYNLSPCFAPLSEMLQELNSDRSMEILVTLLAHRVTEEAARLMKASGINEVEVGLQSTSGTALRNVKRPFNRKKFLEGLAHLKKQDMKVNVDLILGLPGETRKSIQRTIEFVSGACGVDSVWFFLLSIYSGAGIWHDCRRFGITHQEHPPYFVLESPRLPWHELKDAVRECESRFTHHHWHRTPPRWSRTSHGRYPGMPAAHEGGELSDFPVTRILVNLRETGDRELIIRYAERISRHLAGNVTLWLEGAGETHLPLVKNLLSVLSYDNPYTVWNLILEPCGPLPISFPGEALSGIRYLPNYLDYASLFLGDDPRNEYVRTAARAFILLPGEGEYRAEWVREMNRNHPVYWKVFVEPGGSEGVCRRILNLREKYEGDGFVLHFSPLCSTIEVLQTMSELRRRVRGEPLSVTDLVLQKEWEGGGADFADISGLAPVEEHVVSFEPSSLTGELLSRKRMASDYLGWLKRRSGTIKRSVT